MERGDRVRLVDVARAAGVSLSAASVALNGRPGVGEATRSRVVGVARKLGYVADAHAAAMRSGRTKVIGVVAEDLTSVDLAVVVTAAAAAGLLVAVATPAQVGLLVSRGVDALVSTGSDKAATAWSKTGKPLVVLGEGRLPKGATRAADAETAVAALTDAT